MERKWNAICCRWLASVLGGLAKSCVGLPTNIGSAVTDDDSGGTELPVVAVSVAVCATACLLLLLVGCVCCQRRQHGFKEKDVVVKRGVVKHGRVRDSCTNVILKRQEFRNPAGICVDPGHVNPMACSEFTIFGPLSSTMPMTTAINNNESPSDGSGSGSGIGIGIGSGDFARNQLRYIRELGNGWFGMVVEGEARNADGRPGWTAVTVRILESHASSQERVRFLKEAELYGEPGEGEDRAHPNVLRLLGRCLESPPLLLIQERPAGPDLKRFLQDNARNRSSVELISLPSRWSRQLASAVEHIHRRGITHSDLAARNCLLAGDLSLRLGDYGLGPSLYPSDYYAGAGGGGGGGASVPVPVPVRWCAPESVACTPSTLRPLAASAEANVWSLAVTLWETHEWGAQPYGDMSDDEVVSRVLGGSTELPAPRDAGDRLCDILLGCFQRRPELRPSASQLSAVLAEDDFDSRWERLRPNGSLTNLFDDCGVQQSLQLQQQQQLQEPELRREEEDAPESLSPSQHSSDTTEDETWRSRVERGAYSEKVRQKSKSVADLMVLTHIECSDTDSETPFQSLERAAVRYGSAGNLSDGGDEGARDAFREELRELRERQRRDSLLFVPTSPSPPPPPPPIVYNVYSVTVERTAPVDLFAEPSEVIFGPCEDCSLNLYSGLKTSYDARDKSASDCWEPGDGWFLHSPVDEAALSELRSELRAVLPADGGVDDGDDGDADADEDRTELLVHYGAYAVPLSPIPEEEASDSDGDSDGDSESDGSVGHDSCCSSDTLFNLDDDEELACCGGASTTVQQVPPLPSPEDGRWRPLPADIRLSDPQDSRLSSTSFGAEEEEDDDDDDDETDEEEEEEEEESDCEFVPSAWDALAAPAKSAMRSPEKNNTAAQKKAVWFKKQTYHSVYEYPREPDSPTPPGVVIIRGEQPCAPCEFFPNRREAVAKLSTLAARAAARGPSLGGLRHARAGLKLDLAESRSTSRSRSRFSVQHVPEGEGGGDDVSFETLPPRSRSGPSEDSGDEEEEEEEEEEEDSGIELARA